jgi:hypothetical protein
MKFILRRVLWSIFTIITLNLFTFDVHYKDGCYFRLKSWLGKPK